MTNSISVKLGDKVLEIGTGSGYQSAYLSNLTDKVWSIEIIKPLAQRTWALYDSLIGRGYSEYKSITTKQADGYYGWEEEAPFDKIIVTCGIDHIPPPLLQQLKPGGIMVIPVGPPGVQHLLKILKQQAADGAMSVVRSDIYNGRSVSFVPFTKLEEDVIKGTHRAK
jgi:protein-L-isoaspartate(D-aspartate) O-methyltransferase